MSEEPKSDLLRHPGSSEKDNAPVNVDAILQSILGRGSERFGLAAAVLRGERIIAQGAAGTVAISLEEVLFRGSDVGGGWLRWLTFS